jgi:hypothetical protein
VAGYFEHNNEPSGSLNGREFLYYLSNYWFVKTDCSMELVINLAANFQAFCAHGNFFVDHSPIYSVLNYVFILCPCLFNV